MYNVQEYIKSIKSLQHTTDDNSVNNGDNRVIFIVFKSFCNYQFFKKKYDVIKIIWEIFHTFTIILGCLHIWFHQMHLEFTEFTKKYRFLRINNCSPHRNHRFKEFLNPTILTGIIDQHFIFLKNY